MLCFYRVIWAFTFFIFTGLIASAQAASADAIDGRSLSLLWITPFAGILLSIALFPLLAPHFWHKHYGKVSLFWGLAFLIPFTFTVGGAAAFSATLHAAALEYIPFIILVGALFTIAGGIHITGNLRGSPLVNGIMLLIGMVLASFVGTTGASMIMIRPMIRANDDRPFNTHVFVFFIFLVSNIGGALTPLGDPPLFLGFLRGVDFFWPLQALWKPMLLVSGLVFAAFLLVDWYYYKKEGRTFDPTVPSRLSIKGLINLPIIALLIAVVLISGSISSFGTISWAGVDIEIKNILRDALILGLAILSLLFTPKLHRESNAFSWEPLIEVAKLFAAIFITIIPALAILRAGSEGAMASLHTILTTENGAPNPLAYFWMTGLLSSLLDNAPTYLVFFEAASGRPDILMGPLSQTLMAISAGAVFMGANTYIGNAPNFMVKAVAEQQGVKMPSFFGYMGWAALFLLPSFVLVSWIFFM